MANDNNNINTDELTAGSGSTGKSSACTADGADGPSSVEQPVVGTAVQQPASATPEVPRREENPFSFKHFLKWDGGSGSHATATHTANGAGSSGSAAVAQTSINHSRSTSNINGHGSVTGGTIAGECRTNEELLGTAGTSCGALTVSASGGQGTAGTVGSPSKSATTSSLNVVSSTTTGARPKIPQFQSVNTLSSESKMKRSPRFPSFDSQSSLSDFAAEELRFPRPTGSTGIYQSRSNSSFTADYAPSGSAVPSGAGRARDDAAGRTRDVQRSYSHYDMDDSPGSDSVLVDGPEDAGPPNSTRLVGEAAAEFAAALPDFVQDHLVMEQWYNTLPKGGCRGGGGGGGSRSGPVGSGSSGSLEFDDMVELAGTLGRSDAPALLNDMPFDLTAGNIGTGGAGGRSRGGDHGTTPLDLPAAAPAGGGGPELAFDLTQRRRITPTPSADLPPDLTEGGGNAELGGGSVSGSVGNGPYFYPGSSPPMGVQPGTADSKIHRLPDFLSDGPIHSSGRLADVTHDTPHGTDERSARHRHQQQQHQRELHFQNRLEMEQMVNERLRRELDNSRRTVGDQARRIRELERDLETMVTMAAPQHQHPTLAPTGGSGSTQSNANSFMLAKSRAATAEAEVERMKQKLTNMGAELEALRRENERLKESGEGAIGGTGAGASALPRDGLDSGAASATSNIRGRGRHRRQAAEARSVRFLRAQTLALRQAAASAENNLRQLLSGVENLRSMANEIESFSGTTTTLHGSGGVEEMADGSYGRRVVVNAVDVEDDGAEATDGDDDDDDDDERDALGPAL